MQPAAISLSPTYATGVDPSDRRSARTQRAPGNTSANSVDTPASTTSTGSNRADDTASLSPEARAYAGGSTTAAQRAGDPADTGNDGQDKDTKNKVEDSAKPRGNDGEPLTDEEVKQVEKLKARDTEVRQHEQAHVAAGGPYVTSGPTYEYQQGPDGKRYAVGGSVGIDTSPEDTPEKTISKAQTVRRAALAPAEPSAQDRRVAAQASQMEQQARSELAAERQAEAQQSSDADQDDGTAASTSDASATTGTTPQLEQAYTSPPASSNTFRATA